jgi:hypothetical protein
MALPPADTSRVIYRPGDLDAPINHGAQSNELDVQHPLFCEMKRAWKECRDCAKGQDAIKECGTYYLPPTVGMLMDWEKGSSADPKNEVNGQVRFMRYLDRANFDHHFQDGQKQFIGLMWSKEPKIEGIPKELEYMMKLKPEDAGATRSGTSLVDLIRQINQQQLEVSREGLMLDLPDGIPSPDKKPYFATYCAESIINWDASKGPLEMVVLDESGPVREGFRWIQKKKRRVLMMQGGYYAQGAFVGEDAVFNASALEAPELNGRKLDAIPFRFINAQNMLAAPTEPVLYRLAKADIKIFQLDADVRFVLHYLGKDTLVVIGKTGAQKDFRLGPGAAIQIEGQGDAKLIGITGAGLSEMIKTLEDDKAAARVLAGQLIDTRTREKESGEALRVKIGAQTVQLADMAVIACKAVEELLKVAAKWMGLSQDKIDKIKISPNRDYTTTVMEGQTALALADAKNNGFPLSRKSQHKLAQYQGLTDMPYEEELKECLADDKEVIGVKLLLEKQSADVAEETAARSADNADANTEIAKQSAETAAEVAKKKAAAPTGAAA